MKFKRFISLCLAVALCLCLVPGAASAAGDTVYVSASGSDANGGTSASDPVQTLNRALELAAEGDTIDVTGTVLALDPDSNDAPLVITKAVRIQGSGSGAGLALRSGGILLGADVTFAHLSLGTAGFLRPGIAANGHSLTLKDVHQDATLRPLQIYGGSFFDGSGTDYGAAVRGESSTVNIIGGDCDAVFAGSLNGPGVAPVRVRVAEWDFLDPADGTRYDATVDGIYAGSAVKDPADTATAGQIPQLDETVALGVPVSIRVADNARVGTVDGVAEANEVSLEVEGEGRYSFPMAGIDNLTVLGGTFAPDCGSDLPDITLSGTAENAATLDLSAVEGDTLTVGGFTCVGSGILVLSADASLNVTGLLSGTTEFRTGGGMPWGSGENPGYSGLMEYSRCYITHTGTGDGGFAITHPYPTQTLSFVGDGGTWTTSEEPEFAVELFSFAFAEDAFSVSYECINKLSDDPSDNFARIPVQAQLGDYSYLSWLPLIFRVNGGEAVACAEDDSGNFYCHYTAANLRLEGYTDDQSENFDSYIWATRLDDSQPIAAGEYLIEVTAPTNSGPVTDSIVLTVLPAESEETDPTDPGETTTPTTPTEPEETTTPTTPTEPEETTTPTEPEETTTPTTPTEPEETTTPTDPTEPEEMTTPTTPTEPEETTTPTDPTEPEETTAPTAPTEPEETTAPTDPTDPTDPDPVPKTFEDVAENAWFKPAVDFATGRGLFQGVTETTFCPDDPMTRGMLAVVLHRMEGSPARPYEGRFTDVAREGWFAEAVEWAAGTGIVTGYGGGLFGPDDNITREQLAAMLWRYAGSPESGWELSGFADAEQISGYALPAISWANENGIMGGKGGGILDPGGNATRAEVAQMLMRFLSLDS